MLPNLIPQVLHQKDGLPRIDTTSVYQHARRFVDNHHHAVLITNAKLRPRIRQVHTTSAKIFQNAVPLLTTLTGHTIRSMTSGFLSLKEDPSAYGAYRPERALSVSPHPLRGIGFYNLFARLKALVWRVKITHRFESRLNMDSRARTIR